MSDKYKQKKVAVKKIVNLIRRINNILIILLMIVFLSLLITLSKDSNIVLCLNIMS